MLSSNFRSKILRIERSAVFETASNHMYCSQSKSFKKQEMRAFRRDEASVQLGMYSSFVSLNKMKVFLVLLVVIGMSRLGPCTTIVIVIPFVYHSVVSLKPKGNVLSYLR